MLGPYDEDDKRIIITIIIIPILVPSLNFGLVTSSPVIGAIADAIDGLLMISHTLVGFE